MRGAGFERGAGGRGDGKGREVFGIQTQYAGGCLGQALEGGGYERMRFGGAENDGGFGLLQDVGQFIGGAGCVHGNDHALLSPDGPEGGNPFRPVFGKNDGARARLGVVERGNG